MSNTKENILNISRILFNQKGFKNVTIRMIALELKMSSGNLNYHFKKREDILEALYFEMVASFDQRIENLPKQTITLFKMHQDVHISMSRMVDYMFFWTDLYTLLSISEKITSHFNTVYTYRKNGLSFVLEMFIKNNILKPFKFDFEKTFLIDQVIHFGNTWLYATSLYSIKELTPEYITTQTNSFMFFLYPHLTELGKNEFQKIMPTHFKK